MRRRILIAAVFVVPLVIAAVVVVLVLRQRAQEARTAELLAQWQAAGGALTLAELKPEPIPDERNAAVLYEQAFDILDALDERELQLVAEGQLTRVTRETLRSAEPAIELATQAAEKPSCQWSSTFYEDGTDALLPHLGSSHALKYVLCLEARRSAADGDLGRSLELLNATRQLALHCAEDPTIWGLLVAANHENSALNHFREIFSRQSIPSFHVQAFLEQRLTENVVHRTMSAEGTVVIDWINTKFDPADGITTARDEIEFYVPAQLKVLECIGQPYFARDLKFLDEIEEESLCQTSVTLPPLRSAFRSIAELRRLEVAARTAIALRRYHDVHGEYPDPAEWDMPIDPLSGQPMIYRRTGTGFVITGSLEEDPAPLSWQWE